jgi:peptidoglycan hydrolase-like protein with peptidoglycan-binding domain
MSKKLLVAGVLMSLVAVMLVAGATTTSAQTMSLCQTVDALVLAGVIAPDKVVAAKAAAGCAAAAPATAAFTRNLTIGSTGADVTALQTKLGVTPATGYFGAITKAAVMAYQTANGIVPASGYVGPLTLAKLNAGVVVAPVTPVTPVTPVSTLNGGAGDLSLDDTNTSVKNSLKEGEENVKVLGITAEADGSDIAVTSIKVTLEKASSTSDGSEKLSSYLDEVTVWMGSKKVGSADVSDFSKTSDTPDTFSKTISLSDAVVEDGEDVKIYVAVSAVSDVDTEDINEDLKLTVNTVRFNDATGAILTASLSGVAAQEFGFDAGSADTSFDMKTSSSNPDDDTVTVEDNEDSITDDVLALVFKLDVADDSEDIMITSIPVVLTVATSTATSSATIEDIIDMVTVTLDGQTFEAEFSTSTVANNAGTATYIVDIDAGDVELSGGDVKDVKVYLAFKGIEDGNYAEDTTVVASVNEDTIDAETADDELANTQKGGSDRDGAELTLSTSAVLLSNMSWTVATGGAFVDFNFTVKADTADFAVLASSIASSTAGTATTSVGVLSRVSGDTASSVTEGVTYTVSEGDTINFRVRYTLSGVNGTWKEITITNIVGKVVPDDKQVSPTATRNISAN